LALLFPQVGQESISTFILFSSRLRSGKTSIARPDWNKWAAAAGLDEWEKRVLGYRLTGTGRERALALQTDEESRKALQAAWKRFDRNGMERLRQAAKINVEQMSATANTPLRRRQGAEKDPR
jgi:hypothetical protein